MLKIEAVHKAPIASKAVELSVIICTYNRCDLLRRTLKGLLDQETGGVINYEVIVVDNNSTDKTKEVAEELGKNFDVSFRYIFEVRQGKGYALNRGINEARGEILACADDDVTVSNGWVRNIAAIFRTKDIDLLGGKVELALDFNMPEWVDEIMWRGPLGTYDLGENYIENNTRKILPIGGNFSIRKSACKKFGNFLVHDGRSQDTEFAARWDRLGAKIAYSPDSVVKHHISSQRVTKNFFRKWYFLCGKNNVEIFKDKFTRGRRFFGISLWVYKELVVTTIKFIRKIILNDKKYFTEEIWLLYYFGIIYGRHGYRTSFEDLRA